MSQVAADTLNKLNERIASPSAAIHQDASATIVQAVCSGRPIVGVVAATGEATSAVIRAALDDLASCKTRIVRAGPAMLSCLGPASAMDHLRVTELQVNGGSRQRSEQIVQGLQLLGRPIPGEARRLLVIEEAESVDKELLEKLACMSALATPVLPLQLLYVGAIEYWNSLVGLQDGTAKRIIGSPLMLLQAPVKPGPIAPSAQVGTTVKLAGVTQPTSQKVSRARWLFAGLGVLGFGGLFGMGLANQGRLAAFTEAYHARAQDAAEAPTKTIDSAGPSSGTSKAEIGPSVYSGSKTPKTGGKPTATQPDTSKSAAILDAAPSRAVVSDKPAALDVNHVPPPQEAGLPPELPVATLDPAAAAKMISTSMSRGNAMLSLHDLSAARRYYELAARVGSADAALALGRTYDPTSLVRSGTVSAQPDAISAADWYRKAATLGSSEADVALRNLGR